MSRVLHRSDGAGLVEFGLVVPVLLVILFAFFEFGYQFYARLTIRHAVSEAARYAITGNQLADPESGEPMGRAESVLRVLEERAGNFPLEVDGIVIDPPDGGGPEEVVTVSATFRYEYWLPGLAEFIPPTNFTVKTAMRNEPFYP